MKEAISSASEKDQGLIQSTLSGDSQAFGQLVEKYQERLYNSITRLLGFRYAEDAEDVVQETFIKAFEKLETFRGASNFYTWLYRIAFNTAVSHQRRKPRTTSLDQRDDAMGPHIPDDGDRPYEKMERAETARQVQKALDTLSEERRTILILREVESFSYEHIADFLSISVGTVRSRLHRARICLREEFHRATRKDFE